MPAERLIQGKDEERRRYLAATDHTVIKMMETYLKANATLTTAELAILDTRSAVRLLVK